MRSDHTNWLIHFVKDRDLDCVYTDDDYNNDVEDAPSYDPIGGELESDTNAFGVLLTVIKLGGVFPGHSIRNGRTTLYGGQPVICATEMPIYSFAKYSQKDGANVSAYGIAFLKSEFYAAGGRPVIYGLSGDNLNYVTNTKRSRIISPEILPVREQYRYVAYKPLERGWIDWSHEREWRWVYRGQESHSICSKPSFDSFDSTPGLPFFIGTENGGNFSQLAIIVWTEEEAKKIQILLTSFYFAGSNDYDTVFSSELLLKSKIIILKNVVNAVEESKLINAQTIEGLEEGQFLKPILIQENTESYQPLIDSVLLEVSKMCQKTADEFVRNQPADIDICGYAYPVTYELTNPIVQQLIKCGATSGPYDGKLVINTPKVEPSRQGISYNESVARTMTEILNRRIGDFFYMHSFRD